MKFFVINGPNLNMLGIREPAIYGKTTYADLVRLVEQAAKELQAVALPAVEVHISNVKEREEFRQISYAGQACFHTVMGEGIEGYRIAMRVLKEKLTQQS